MNNAKYWIIGGVTTVLVISLAVGFWYLRSRAPDSLGSTPDQQKQTTDVEVLDPEFEPDYDFPTSTTDTGGGDNQPPEYYQELRRKEFEDFFGRPFGSSPEPPPDSEISEESTQVPEPPTPPPDRDGDGLTDEQEATRGTNPDKADTDGDGLTDLEEIVTYKTDPTKADTDGDTFSDGQEVKAKYNPLGPGPCARETCIP